MLSLYRGSFEWKGDWSDSSPLWKQHPGVAFEIGKPAEVDDGMFYMAWTDFVTYFDIIDVLEPMYGEGNLCYEPREADGRVCGLCTGFVCGCFVFWCRCRGINTLLFERDLTEAKKELGV